MEMNFDKLLGQVTDFIHSEANTKTVVGEEFQLGAFSCVPIIKVNMGFGTGGGEGSDPKKGSGKGGGAGAGVSIVPMGFLVSKGDEIRFIKSNTSKGLAAAFEKMPELLDKFIDKQTSKKEEESTD